MIKKWLLYIPWLPIPRNENNETSVKSYVWITDVLQHSFPTTYSFLELLMAELKKTYPALSICHFISDSPTSQYRNRFVCAMIARFRALFGVYASWSWLEKGHGKGPCDGVGGAVKKLADGLVKKAQIIDSADKFCTEVSEANSVITLLKVDKATIDTNAAKILKWQSGKIKGIMDSHIATGIGKRLHLRATSCFKPCCYHAPMFLAKCGGWKKTGMVMVNEYDQEKPKEDSADNHDGDLTSDVHDFEEESDYDDDDNIPVLDLIRKNKIVQTVNVGSFVAVVYGRRWYIVRVEKSLILLLRLST